MPLTKLQSLVLRTLAAGRSPDSYVAGGVAINRDGPRYSQDIDVFQDSEDRLAAAAAADAATLSGAGFEFTWIKRQVGRRRAKVANSEEAIYLDWVADSDFRFFPAQPDELFGYVLHPVDLATNKAAAAADRREPRDIVDLLTIHETILRLGPVICAAVGRFPGESPEAMLQEIRSHSRFTAEEFRNLATDGPIEPETLHKKIRDMLQSAETFIHAVPSDAVGFVFLKNSQLIEPDPFRLDDYERRGGARLGAWPSSGEISRAMLERYRE